MEEKCINCGAPMKDGKCSYCGYEAPEQKAQQFQQTVQSAQPQQTQNIRATVQVQYQQSNISPKSRIMALILCVLFGYFGAHYFYVGKSGMGILYFVTMGLFGIGWIIDIIRIAGGSFTDSRGLVLKN